MKRFTEIYFTILKFIYFWGCFGLRLRKDFTIVSQSEFENRPKKRQFTLLKNELSQFLYLQYPFGLSEIGTVGFE